jgi:hypothetical protein
MSYESQCAQILDYIRNKGSITTMEAFQELGCTRLSGRIYDLREQGIPISKEMVEANGKRFARYSLN